MRAVLALDDEDIKKHSAVIVRFTARELFEQELAVLRAAAP